jgi:hypothetical protein
MTKTKTKTKPKTDVTRTDLLTALDIYTKSVVILARQHPRPPRRMSWTRFVLKELVAALERSLAADARSGKTVSAPPRRRGLRRNAVNQ